MSTIQTSPADCKSHKITLKLAQDDLARLRREAQQLGLSTEKAAIDILCTALLLREREFGGVRS